MVANGDKFNRLLDLIKPQSGIMTDDEFKEMIARLRKEGYTYTDPIEPISFLTDMRHWSRLNEVEKYLQDLGRLPPSPEESESVEPPLPTGKPFPPPRVPFTNRGDEINVILSSFAPAYYLLDAPAGYGKTELMQQLKERFVEKNWICAYTCVKKGDGLLDAAQSLSQELELDFSPISEVDPRSSGENWAGALKVQKGEAITQTESGLALLIDLDKKPSLRLVKMLVQEFIPGIQESLRGLKAFAAQHNRFRVILAGRYLAGREEIRSPLVFHVLQLTPFDYDVIRETVTKCLPDYDESWIKQLAAHFLHFTGGHPGCIAQVLELYTDRCCPPPDRFFAESGKEIWETIVHPTVNSVRDDIPRRLRGILDRLSIFRYLDYRVLEQFVTGDEPVIRGYRDASQLADKLTGTYLLSWKGRLLRDDITRRLLVMRLRKRDSRNKWSERCKSAHAICAERLREPTTQMPEFRAIEYLFQSLQQHAKDIDDLSKERAGIRHAFFEEHVPEALNLLLSSSRGMRIREEQQALEEALAAKENWEFRFTVNYYLREDQYSTEPFIELERRVARFFIEKQGRRR